MSHNDTYQMECPKCRSIAVLRERAAPVQTYIGRDPRRSFSPLGSSDGVTGPQPGAESWAQAIDNRLQREIAAHERCGACSILMGPGHVEEAAEGFCATHSKTAGTRSAPVPDSRADSLGWVADQEAH